MAEHDPRNRADATLPLMAFADMVARSDDLAPLMTGSLGDRIESITAFCKRLPTIEATGIHLVYGMALTPPDGKKAPSASTPQGEDTAQGGIWPSKELLAQVAASATARYETLEGKNLPADTPGDVRSPTPVATYMVPLGPQGRILAVLLAGTRQANGIPVAIRRLLDVLAPLFALALENACLRRYAPFAAPQGYDLEQPPDDVLDPSRVDSLAHLAHDIKNAMTTVTTFMQLLPAKWGEAHFRSSFYTAARDEAMRVNGLVNAMLDRKRRHPPKRVPVALQALLKDLLARKAPLAEQRRLRLCLRTGRALAILRIDRDAISEAVVNLLSNAMEASPDGGCIEIRLEDDVMPNGQPAVRLDIRDGGPGVDEALRKAIFAPYVSTKNGNPATGGTGLPFTHL